VFVRPIVQIEVKIVILTKIDVTIHVHFL